MNNKPEQPSKQSNKLISTKDIEFLWGLITKNLGFIIFMPMLAYAIGYVYTHRLTSIYGSKIQLLLKSEETYDYQSQIYQGLGAYGMYMDVQNQIRILKSRDLLGEVVDKMDINTSYYVVGRIKKKEVYETLPVKSSVTILNPNVYEVPVTVTILDLDTYRLTYELGQEEFTHEYFFGQDLVTDNFIIKLDERYSFNSENINTIKSSQYEIVFHSRNYSINKYQTALNIENLEYTSVLDISLEDELLERGMAFLDTLTSVYVDFSKRIQLEVNQNTLENIERQIDTVAVIIQQKEEDLLNYKNVNAILNPEKEEDEFFIQYVEYTKAKRELMKRKTSFIALKTYMEETENNRLLPPSFYIEKSDLYLSEAVSQVRSLEVDLQIKLTHAKEENSMIVDHRKKIVMLKKDIIAYIDNSLIAVDAEIGATDFLILQYQKNIKSLPHSQQGISNIQRELDVNNKMYLFLLEKKTNTLIARAGIIPQVRVLEKASSLGQVYPDKKGMLRLFTLAGFLLAFFIAIIRKLFFEKIENLKELKDVTHFNAIGGVPFIKNLQNEIIVNKDPKSAVTESFRAIRTNISFMTSDNTKSNTIIISSFFPGEGKTFCATNLASLIARGDKKVLIIDFDLHRPKVHKTFEIENSLGVTTYIIGKSNFDEIVHKGISTNLDVISAGPISPNPSELILRNKVDELLTEAKQIYDYVLIDTPPFGLLNDTLELAKKADAMLVVMNTKYARKRGVQHIETILENYDSVNMAMILNGIRQKKFQYYYSKYSYKYTYGYNYGYNYNYTTDEKDD